MRRHDVVHRVRPLPGRLPGLRDRQGALAEAPDHGHPRPAVRARARPAGGGDGGEGSTPRRSCRTPSPTTSSGTASPAAPACASARSSIEHVDHIVDLRRHLVMVESTLPGRGRRRCCATSSAAPTRGASRRPSAPTGRTASTCACCEPGDAAARGAVLGRLRAVLRRARARGRALDGEAAAGGRRRLRHPRPARVLHRRPGAADGQRVHVPVATRSRTSRRWTRPA